MLWQSTVQVSTCVQELSFVEGRGLLMNEWPEVCHLCDHKWLLCSHSTYYSSSPHCCGKSIFHSCMHVQWDAEQHHVSHCSQPCRDSALFPAGKTAALILMHSGLVTVAVNRVMCTIYSVCSCCSLTVSSVHDCPVYGVYCAVLCFQCLFGHQQRAAGKMKIYCFSIKAALSSKLLCLKMMTGSHPGSVLQCDNM